METRRYWQSRDVADAPGDVALAYKELWIVEDLFGTMKSVLETRPIYHQRDETIRGHLFCSFMVTRSVPDQILSGGNHFGIASHWRIPSESVFENSPGEGTWPTGNGLFGPSL